jgi:hypothetical protein
MQYQQVSEGFHHGETLNDNGALTEDEFEELFDKCCKIVHVWNPFDPNTRSVDFKLPISEWLQKITNLLKQHQMRLVDTDKWWLIVMSSAEDGKPHAYTLEPVAFGKEVPTPKTK